MTLSPRGDAAPLFIPLFFFEIVTGGAPPDVEGVSITMLGVSGPVAARRLHAALQRSRFLPLMYVLTLPTEMIFRQAIHNRQLWMT
ncbi:hypothetical protein [Pandoraea sputorum]|uniref:hypothetical protein n=1 Tax=Pandoraea sputorum TaxID=93222 RepID=UPI00057F61B7|nr:hypothetical protein [Pandoraea sputorum]AJC18093.1 hypothetical protein NA29_22895 [Pandoraea sputorum]